MSILVHCLAVPSISEPMNKCGGEILLLGIFLRKGNANVSQNYD
jgi:hypothetical protein